MRYVVLLVVVLLVAIAACSGKTTTTPSPVGSGTGSAEKPPGGGNAASCDELKPHLQKLYRAEAQAREPKRVDEAVADNTTMVLNDCAKAPDKVVPCVNAAATVAELETRCLQPLDEEGSEGLELRK